MVVVVGVAGGVAAVVVGLLSNCYCSWWQCRALLLLRRLLLLPTWHAVGTVHVLAAVVVG